MHIIGRSTPFSSNTIASGLDSVTEGIVQSTQSQGIVTLDTAINSFSTVDPNATNILDQQPQVSEAGEFPDPSSFLESEQNTDDVIKFIADPGFQPAIELSNFSKDLSNFFPGVRGKVDVPDELKTLEDMQSAVIRLNDLQSNMDSRLQMMQLLGRDAKVRPQDRSATAQQKQVDEKLYPELMITATIEQEKDPIEFKTSTKTSLGPILEGDADADIGKNTYLDIGGEAFFGAKASAAETVEVGEYGSVTGGAGVYAGIGANGDLDLGVKDGKLKFKIGGGFAFGIGGEIDLGFDLDYGKIAEDLYNAGSDVMDKAGDLFKGIGEELKSAGETIEETGEDVIDVIEDTAEDVVDGLGDAADSTGDFVEDTLDW